MIKELQTLINKEISTAKPPATPKTEILKLEKPKTTILLPKLSK